MMTGAVFTMRGGVKAEFDDVGRIRSVGLSLATRPLVGLGVADMKRREIEDARTWSSVGRLPVLAMCRERVLGGPM